MYIIIYTCNTLYCKKIHVFIFINFFLRCQLNHFVVSNTDRYVIRFFVEFVKSLNTHKWGIIQKWLKKMFDKSDRYAWNSIAFQPMWGGFEYAIEGWAESHFVSSICIWTHKIVLPSGVGLRSGLRPLPSQGFIQSSTAPSVPNIINRKKSWKLQFQRCNLQPIETYS